MAAKKLMNDLPRFHGLAALAWGGVATGGSACRLWLAAGLSGAGLALRPHELSQRSAQRIEPRGVGKSVAFDGAPDCRCYRGEFVVGEVNCRHGPDIIGRHLSNKKFFVREISSR